MGDVGKSGRTRSEGVFSTVVTILSDTSSWGLEIPNPTTWITVVIVCILCTYVVYIRLHLGRYEDFDYCTSMRLSVVCPVRPLPPRKKLFFLVFGVCRSQTHLCSLLGLAFVSQGCRTKEIPQLPFFPSFVVVKTLGSHAVILAS